MRAGHGFDLLVHPRPDAHAGIEDRVAAVLAALVVVGLIGALGLVAQLVVGRLIDRFALRPLMLAIVLVQVPMLYAAAHAQGEAFAGLRLAADSAADDRRAR